MKINLNDRVKVTLTSYGKDVYENALERYSPKHLVQQEMAKVTIKDELTISLWELMNLFGPQVFHGNVYQVFVDNRLEIVDLDVYYVIRTKEPTANRYRYLIEFGGMHQANKFTDHLPDAKHFASSYIAEAHLQSHIDKFINDGVADYASKCRWIVVPIEGKGNYGY